MTLSRRSKFRLMVVAGLLTPGALVQGFRLLSGATLAPASASVVSAAPPVPIASEAVPQVTPEQKRAMEWLALRRGGAPVRSPMDHPTVAVEPEPEPEAVPEVVAKPDPFAGLVVSSIMIGGDQEPMAVINGRVHRVGDFVRGKWQISQIDRFEWLVHLTNDQGEAGTLAMKRPELHN